MFNYKNNNVISYNALCEGIAAGKKAYKNIIKELQEDENLDEAELLEATTTELMSNEDLKIESLKIATNIAKLMADVTTEDIIEIADTVSDFIRNHLIGSTESDKKDDDNIDFDLDGFDMSKDEEESEENDEESEENDEESEE